MKPKLSAVAREASVSLTTASLVLRGKGNRSIPNATRERVIEAATRLGYPFAIHRESTSFGTIALFIGEIATESEARGDWDDCAALLVASMYAASTRNQKLIILKPWHLPKIDSIITEESVSGCILMRKEGRDDVSRLCSLVPCVDLFPDVGQYHVYPDIDAMVNLVLSHFGRLGHSRLCYLLSPNRSELEKAKVETIKEKCVLVNITPMICASSQDALRLLKTKKPPTAFWAHDDLAARHLWTELSQQGLHVPKDVSIIGTGNSPIASCPDLGLTSISPSWDAIIHKCIDLIEAISKKQSTPLSHSIQPRLVVRTSTGPAP